MSQIMVQLIAAFLGSLGFALLFNIRGNRLLPAATGGLLAWGTYLVVGIWSQSDPLRFLIASIVLTFYAELFARIKKTPATLFLVAGTIPLIPGGYLYHTMNDAVHGRWTAFLVSGKDTMVLAVAIAIGMLVAMSVLQSITRINAYRICLKTKKNTR